MKVLVDTSVWSAVLRRDIISNKEIKKKLVSLILNNDALIIGPIRQEILSGYSNRKKFNSLKEKLSAFPNLEILGDDYISAAELSNECRSKGIQGSHTDFLICAISIRCDTPIFTLDKDFENYSRAIKIRLY